MTGFHFKVSVSLFKKLTSPILSPGNLTVLDSHLLKNSSWNQTSFFQLFHSPQSGEECGIFDPIIGNGELAKCDTLRGAVCQFKKGNVNGLWSVNGG